MYNMSYQKLNKITQQNACYSYLVMNNVNHNDIMYIFRIIFYDKNIKYNLLPITLNQCNICYRYSSYKIKDTK